ncbi:mechanosensitive ion channel family protein [Radiobacillus sp. PE A8.2]|uniref:mechanosensitive ion channel family protein n=1 Tax=Radiobacillus sp. PE A8.2 TaxID=3380349 RepID=UPI00388E51E5
MDFSMSNELLKTIWEHSATKLTIAAILAILFLIISRKIIHSFFKRTDFIEEKKERTLELMLNSLIRYVVTFAFLFYFINITFDVELGSILAGAGIIGIVVGFGAQSLITDLFAGVFLLYEKQLQQGDWVKVNNTYSGTVEDIGLRFLKIRQWSGVLLTISNGKVTAIENYNMEKMRVLEHVTTSFYEDPKKMFSLLEEVCERLNIELHTYLKKDITGAPVEPFTLYGMSSLNDQYRGYKYTVSGLCNDAEYFTAAKETRRIIAEALFENNIQMAEQRVEMRSE